jgi:hypothetical protein
MITAPPLYIEITTYTHYARQTKRCFYIAGIHLIDPCEGEPFSQIITLMPGQNGVMEYVTKVRETKEVIEEKMKRVILAYNKHILEIVKRSKVEGDEWKNGDDDDDLESFFLFG